MSPAVSVALLLLVLGLVYLLMWLGWRRRGRKHDLPPLPEVGGDVRRGGSDVTPPFGRPVAARYFGTTVGGDWLDRVVARGLGTRSTAELLLSHDGLDVRRPRDAFRIPAPAMRGARRAQGIAGKVVPPSGVLVVTWRHGDLLLDSGFRLADSARHDTWIAAIDTLTKEHQA